MFIRFEKPKEELKAFYAQEYYKDSEKETGTKSILRSHSMKMLADKEEMDKFCFKYDENYASAYQMLIKTYRLHNNMITMYGDNNNIIAYAIFTRYQKNEVIFSRIIIPEEKEYQIEIFPNDKWNIACGIYHKMISESIELIHANSDDVDLDISFTGKLNQDFVNAACSLGLTPVYDMDGNTIKYTSFSKKRDEDYARSLNIKQRAKQDE